MSDRLERSTRATERETNPQTERPDIFDFLEEKWRDKKEGPRWIDIRLAFGPGGGTWREDIIHREEFKKNADPPKKPEIIELSNKLYATMQRHCNELGRRQGFVILTFNPERGAKPYGIHLVKLLPEPGTGPLGDVSPGEGGGYSDGQHRDMMMQAHLEHVRESNEHVRFMADANHKYTGQILAIQQETIRELRDENRSYRAQQLEFYKAIEEVNSKRHERKMEEERQQVLMSLVHGAIPLLGPVFQRALEKHTSTPTAAPQLPVPSAPTPIAAAVPPGDASRALEAFALGLTDDQRSAVFGYPDATTGKYVPGILTSEQVNILIAVADLRSPDSILSVLMPGGKYAIGIDQIGLMVPILGKEKLLALKEIIDKTQQPSAPEPAPAADEVHP